LKHSILLSELFLGLVSQEGKQRAKIPQNFSWILGEYLDLRFSEYTLEDRNQRRRLQPDAILEIPSQRLHIFIEIETGSATIWDQEKVTSTLAKLNRYSLFLTDYAGNVHHGEASTFYSRAFPDNWPPEVLFVSLSVHRRDSIKAAQEKEARPGRRKNGRPLDDARGGEKGSFWQNPRLQPSHRTASSSGPETSHPPERSPGPCQERAGGAIAAWPSSSTG